MWSECQAAQHPTPLAKLEQAEHDADIAGRDDDLCVAITRKKGTRSTQVAMRLDTLLYLEGCCDESNLGMPVTIDLEDYLVMLKRAMPALEEEAGTLANDQSKGAQETTVQEQRQDQASEAELSVKR